MSDEETAIAHDSARHRYVLHIGEHVIGETVYRDADGIRTFTHTEVLPEYGHQGLATALVRDAIADTRGAGLRPVGVCPLVRTYLAEHPDPAGSTR